MLLILQNKHRNYFKDAAVHASPACWASLKQIRIQDNLLVSAMCRPELTTCGNQTQPFVCKGRTVRVVLKGAFCQLQRGQGEVPFCQDDSLQGKESSLTRQVRAAVVNYNLKSSQR